MSQTPELAEPRASRPRRTRLFWAAIVLLFVGVAGAALAPGRGEPRDDQADLLLIGVWFVIGCAYAWMRWRPRRAYDVVDVRPKAEAFQAKRWALMLLLSAYVGLVLTPLTAHEALGLTPAATVADRLFKAVLFLAPCGLTLGVMTSGIYSRAWGALVDDELTISNRTRAFGFGFAVAIAAGAIVLLIVMFRPDLSVATLPVVIGLGVAGAGARFALLERAAMAQDG